MHLFLLLLLFELGSALGLLFFEPGKLIKMLVNLLLMVLKLVPVLLVVIPELLAKKELNGGILAYLIWALAGSVKVTSISSLLFVFEEVVLGGAVFDKFCQFELLVFVDCVEFFFADPFVVFLAEDGERLSV